MARLDRCRGALIGLAVGEVLGSGLARAGDPYHAPMPLEPPYALGGLALQAGFVARGLVSAAAIETPERLAEALGAAFLDWGRDARVAARAPEATTANAVAAHVAGTAWHRAGRVHSRPAVLAVRAVPLGIALVPDRVHDAARVLTDLTHRDDTGIEAAVFVAWLIGSMVRGAPLDRALVQEGREVVADLGFGGSLADTLADALGMHAMLADGPPRWLPTTALTPNDGGLRADSAVGLAVVAALLAPTPDGFLRGVEVGSRLHGAPAAVAALTGAFLGAARGLSSIPAPVVEPLEDLSVLVGLSDALMAAPADAPTPTPSTHRSWLPGDPALRDVS